MSLVYYYQTDGTKRLTNSHTCEHLLVALKIAPTHPANDPIPWDTHPTLQSLRKGIDTDVVVAEVRETSRKPDEVYGVIERYVFRPVYPPYSMLSSSSPILHWSGISCRTEGRKLISDLHPMGGSWNYLGGNIIPVQGG